MHHINTLLKVLFVNLLMLSSYASAGFFDDLTSVLENVKTIATEATDDLGDVTGSLLDDIQNNNYGDFTSTIEDTSAHFEEKTVTTPDTVEYPNTDINDISSSTESNNKNTSSSTPAPRLVFINNVDTKGLFISTTERYYNDEDAPYTGTAYRTQAKSKDYYRNYFEYSFVDGLYNGISNIWWPNGMLRSSDTLRNDLWHGLSKTWNDKGILLSSSEYKNGNLHGIQSKNNRNGVLFEKKNYVNGVESQDLFLSSQNATESRFSDFSSIKHSELSAEKDTYKILTQLLSNRGGIFHQLNTNNPISGKTIFRYSGGPNDGMRSMEVSFINGKIHGKVIKFVDDVVAFEEDWVDGSNTGYNTVWVNGLKVIDSQVLAGAKHGVHVERMRNNIGRDSVDYISRIMFYDFDKMYYGERYYSGISKSKDSFTYQLSNIVGSIDKIDPKSVARDLDCVLSTDKDTCESDIIDKLTRLSPTKVETERTIFYNRAVPRVIPKQISTLSASENAKRLKFISHYYNDAGFDLFTNGSAKEKASSHFLAYTWHQYNRKQLVDKFIELDNFLMKNKDELLVSQLWFNLKCDGKYWMDENAVCGHLQGIIESRFDYKLSTLGLSNPDFVKMPLLFDKNGNQKFTAKKPQSFLAPRPAFDVKKQIGDGTTCTMKFDTVNSLSKNLRLVKPDGSIIDKLDAIDLICIPAYSQVVKPLPDVPDVRIVYSNLLQKTGDKKLMHFSGESVPFTGLAIQRYKKGLVLKSAATYKNGKLNGRDYRFYASGYIKETRDFINNKIHGSFNHWDVTGYKTFKATFVNGIEQGISTTYFSPDGLDDYNVPVPKIPWQQPLADEYQLLYDWDNVIDAQYDYHLPIQALTPRIDGINTGTEIIFWPNGVKFLETNFVNNVLHGDRFNYEPWEKADNGIDPKINWYKKYDNGELTVGSNWASDLKRGDYAKTGLGKGLSIMNSLIKATDSVAILDGDIIAGGYFNGKKVPEQFIKHGVNYIKGGKFNNFNPLRVRKFTADIRKATKKATKIKPAKPIELKKFYCNLGNVNYLIATAKLTEMQLFVYSLENDDRFEDELIPIQSQQECNATIAKKYELLRKLKEEMELMRYNMPVGNMIPASNAPLPMVDAEEPVEGDDGYEDPDYD